MDMGPRTGISSGSRCSARKIPSRPLFLLVRDQSVIRKKKVMNDGEALTKWEDKYSNQYARGNRRQLKAKMI